VVTNTIETKDGSIVIRFEGSSYDDEDIRDTFELSIEMEMVDSAQFVKTFYTHNVYEELVSFIKHLQSLERP
jgi:hypothetical protein